MRVANPTARIPDAVRTLSSARRGCRAPLPTARLGVPAFKGVAMIRSARYLCAALALFLTADAARADWAALHYGGYQPWWNIFAHRNRYQTCEEERLQRFWHDYYDALHRYYRGLEHIDWVAYYKNHGYRINGGGCG